MRSSTKRNVKSIRFDLNNRNYKIFTDRKKQKNVKKKSKSKSPSLLTFLFRIRNVTKCLKQNLLFPCYIRINT